MSRLTYVILKMSGVQLRQSDKPSINKATYVSEIIRNSDYQCDVNVKIDYNTRMILQEVFSNIGQQRTHPIALKVKDDTAGSVQ